MKLIFRNTIGMAAALALLAGPALAQQGPPHDQDHGPQSEQHPPMQHPEPQHQAYSPPHGNAQHGNAQQGNWHQGDHYNGGRQTVDWHQHHLHQPPSGYEWVQSGNQFVLIAVTTGIIASIIANAAQ
jgi:Ni/Co efflux regulator RcnB